MKHPSPLRVARLATLFAVAACASGPTPISEPAMVPLPPPAVVAQDTVGVRLTERFRKVVLDDRITRAHALDVAPDGRVFFVEREGAVKAWDPRLGETRMVGFVPAYAIHTSGLLGIALDPRFLENGWVYLYYSPHTSTENVLARFTIREGRLVPESREVLLEVPGQRHVEGGHSAGSLAFGPDGTLFLSTGDNTSPRGHGFGPLDERPGREIYDAQRSSGNTWDLRGKILRVRPLPDGSYDIPAGNLFPDGALGRPEIFVMGARNPFRIAVDPRTGWLYWGDVGPDAGAPEEGRGPAGYDEFNQAREAGNFGWPYFVADNKPYHDYDFAAKTSGPAFRAEMPVNESPNNTGARVLPPAQPALIWYPYGDSPEFPTLGTGGRAAMAGPLFRYDARRAGPPGLPAAFDGTLFVFDFMRNWIQEVRLTPDGEIARVQPFLPGMELSRPIAMDVGPDGSLYVIEWGENYEGWYNDNARLVRLEYVGAAAAAGPGRPATAPAGRLGFQWPVSGGVFDFDQPIPYLVGPVAGGPAPREEDVVVQSRLGHDSHTHALRSHAGTRGALQIRRDETHLYLEDHFGLLEASERGAESHLPARVVLQPRRKEAEHATTLQGARREVRGSLRLRRGVEVFLHVNDGSHASYGPVNLVNIDSLTFRVAPGAGGLIEVRSSARDGPLLAQVRVDGATAAAAGGSADGWTEVSTAVRDPGGTHPLFLVFRGVADEPLMRLDWFEFRGAGVMRAPQ